ncbi:septum formation initiator family protein [Oscillospiraceae bacterium 44-34]
MTKLVVLALLIYMAISLIDMRGKIQSVQDQRDDLARQVTDQQLENQKLADAVANSDDPEMLERVVRDRGYVERGETVFIDIAN